MAEDFEVPLDEKTIFLPDPLYCEGAEFKDFDREYQEFLNDPDAFWTRIALELEWVKPWKEICVWEPPFAKWFVGAELNITANCLDRHVAGGQGNHAAIIWKGEDGSERTLSYTQLLHEVMRCANALTTLGIRKGDRVCIYMPVVPEQIVAMLACARIGAVHSVVFAGYGATPLSHRIVDSGAKAVITADFTRRRGKLIPLKPIVDEALAHASLVEHTIVLRTEPGQETTLKQGEHDYATLLGSAGRECPSAAMGAEDTLFILYTSGTTGAPKGVVHTCGGYMVGAYYTTRYVLCTTDKDRYWCTADPGWITGHTYGVYGPLLCGATLFMTEYTPDYPDSGIWWQLIEEYGINIFYTAPTVIRMFMRVGDEWPARYDLSSLKLLGSVGEPLNPEAFLWFNEHIGKNHCPITDTWWQTETGMQMITTLAGQPMKPGFAGRPIPGVTADVVSRDGSSLPPGQGGFLAITSPWPSMMRNVYHDEERYRKYWALNGNSNYMTNDLAVKDHDGYFMILGRSDDLIIVAGHNIGTAEVESALVSHDAVAEAAAIGIPDPIKGNIIKTFVILIEGNERSDALANELKRHVRQELGPIAVPQGITFVDSLPKTRSGKIMRRVLKAQELGMDPGDISTLED
jgi:acetyl-CoA synthetase